MLRHLETDPTKAASEVELDRCCWIDNCLPGNLNASLTFGKRSDRLVIYRSVLQAEV